MSNLKVGDEFEMIFPFRKYEFIGSSGNSLFKATDDWSMWQPGCELHEEDDGSGWGTSRSFTASAEGKVIYKVLAVVDMPGRYQDRIIFKRWCIDPDGKKYNNGEVRTITITAFEKDIHSRSPFKVDYEVE